MCASGAKSPEAPTDPCDGMIGRIRKFTILINSSINSHLTPLAPRASEITFKAIISRTISSSISCPTPAL